MSRSTLMTRGGTPPPCGPDFQITGADVVDPVTGVIRQAVIEIRGGRITAVTPGGAAPIPAQGALPKLDASDYLIIPGLVNVHTHAPMGFFRGLAHGVTNMIETFMFPAEASLTANLLEPLSWSYLIAGLRAGVTVFGDHYYFIEGVGRAADRLGVRAAIGETVADLGGAFPGRDGLTRMLALLDRWPFSTRITPVIAPHAADTVSPDLLRELATLARSHKLPLHMHLSQTAGERQRVLKARGMSPVAYARKCGALGENTLAVHLVTADEPDLQILQDTGITAGICPASQIMYERLAPMEAIRRAGIPIALGTDCAASNDGADMLSEMRLTSLLLRHGNPYAPPPAPEEILAMGTIHGARALGLADRCGRIAPGFAADLVFLRQTVDTLPAPRPDINIICSHSARYVDHVLVDGRFVLYGGEPVLVREAEVRADYLAAVAEIKRRCGFRDAP